MYRLQWRNKMRRELYIEVVEESYMKLPGGDDTCSVVKDA